MAPFITNPYRFAEAEEVGGWVELGRTTLGSASDTITVSSLADKRYYMVLWNIIPTGNVFHEARLNGDTGLNYASRFSTNGGGDGTGTSQPILSNGVAGGSTPAFHVGYWANYSSKEKLGITHSVGQSTAGASTVPIRREIVGKHAQTLNPINEFQAYNSNTGDYGTGSEVVVLGWDPADTHTNNFWEELASVNASGSSTNLSSGTITAKKYLWVQCYSEGTGGDIFTAFNNDNGPNYARRFSLDGGADSTSGSIPSISNMHNSGRAGEEAFSNWFIINNASNEKLCIGHSIQQAGTGATFAPRRNEFVAKWANTSNQITEIDFDSVSGNFGTNSILKVWGAD